MKKISFIILIIISFFIMQEVNADTPYIKGTIKLSKKTNVYSQPSSSSDLLRNDEGYIINLSYPETFEILNVENGYYKIYFQYTSFYYTGYIKEDHNIVKREDFIIKDSTIDQLKAKGFDDTYAYPLAVLKTINPTWKFNLYNTELDWNYVIEKEAYPVEKNLINSTNTYLRSTEDSAYEGNGVWKTFDSGSSWFAASKQTIKYYMDPRNFFNEGHIFMFEKLSYDDSLDYIPAINSVLNGTFMASNQAFSCLEGYSVCYNNPDGKKHMSYTDVFKEAGLKNGVSPVHLASRVRIEQGTGGSVLSSGEGWKNQKQGFYNFFNFGASGDGDDVIINKGLDYAINKGWNSPYASIVGGASSLTNGYIAGGQDTLYFQKFDVIKPASFYHQYQQNIRAPYYEGYTMYSSYHKNEIVGSNFTFHIPIYDNMPTFTNLSVSGNEDATLKSLNIPGCYLMPGFTPSALDYNCSVSKEVSSVKVSAVATNANARVSGAGEVNLETDTNIVSVVVTAAAGNTRTYNITIKKVETSEFTPDEIISRVGININSGFLSGSNIVTTPDYLTTLIKNSFSTATVILSNPEKIGTGTKLTITNNGSKTYNLLVYGDNNGDGSVDILDLLTVQKHLLNSAKLSDVYLKASDANKDGKVDILDLLTIQKYILGTGDILQ